MATTRSAGLRSVFGSRRGFLAFGMALVIAGCGTGSASPTPTPVASVAATPATPTPTAAPTPTPTPTAVPTAPGRLCTGPEEVAAVTIWHVVDGGTEIDFFTGSHSSTDGGTDCYLHGISESQVVAGGAVIADSGAGSAVAADGDPYILEVPADKVYSSVLWSNWCGTAPTQPITLAFVLPGTLGRVVAVSDSGMPAPPCVSSGSPSTVTTTAPWSH